MYRHKGRTLARFVHRVVVRKRGFCVAIGSEKRRECRHGAGVL